MNTQAKKIIKTKERWKNYALWYYFRYFPSNQKLIDKLNEKTEDNKSLVQEIYTEIKHLLQEDEIIRTKISNYINKNKNKRYIINNLKQKKFNTNKVHKILEEEFIPEDWSILIENKTVNTILKYKKRGKSKQYIISKVSECSSDTILLNKLFEQHYTEQEEINNCLLEYNKHTKSNDHQKIIQKLLLKWFNYWLIKNII